MKKKYISPEVETLEVKVEGIVCLSPGSGNRAGTMASEDPDETIDM